MRNVTQIFVIVLFLSATLFANETKKFGKEITLKEKTNISDIIANPEVFVGKKVLVEGTIVEVCAKRGCWIKLAGDKEFESMRIKVKDGEIIFPLEAKGKTALVEGEVYSYKVEEECKDGKEENKKGEEHNCANGKTEKTIYQIKGLGAVIK